MSGSAADDAVTVVCKIAYELCHLFVLVCQVLIEKDWLSFGHKFADRLGFETEDCHASGERSPIFFQVCVIVRDGVHMFKLVYVCCCGVSVCV